MVTGIGHIAIRCKDIIACADFYTNVLGMKEAFRMNNDKGELSTVYIIMAKDVFLELFPNGVEMQEPPAGAAGLVHICLQVEDIEAAYAECKAKGAPIERDIMTGRSGSRQFFTKDPDGNRIEMMQLLPDSMHAEANRRFFG